MFNVNTTITVIIPCYNTPREDFNKCIESIKNQSHRELEIIIIDDGSQNQISVECDQYLLLDSRVSIVHKWNGGVSQARNVGLSISNGDYVTFVDSDDWVELRSFEILYRLINEMDADLVACGIVQESTLGSFPESENDGSFEEIKGESCYESLLHDYGVRGYLWNKLFVREKIKKKIDESISQCEDLLFVAEYLEGVKKIVYTRNDLYHYRRAVEPKGFEYSKRTLSLLDAYEKLLLVYEDKAPKYACSVRANTLKHYLNIRSRYLVTHDTDKELWERICCGINTHMKTVMRSNSVIMPVKITIVISFLFPRFSIKIKKLIKKIRQKHGDWES